MVLITRNRCQPKMTLNIKRNLRLFTTNDSVLSLGTICARHWNEFPTFCNLLSECFPRGFRYSKLDNFRIWSEVTRCLRVISGCGRLVIILFNYLCEVVFSFHELFEVFVGLWVVKTLDIRSSDFVAFKSLFFLGSAWLVLDIGFRVDLWHTLLSYFGLGAFLLFIWGFIDNFTLFTSCCFRLQMH